MGVAFRTQPRDQEPPNTQPHGQRLQLRCRPVTIAQQRPLLHWHSLWYSQTENILNISSVWHVTPLQKAALLRFRVAMLSALEPALSSPNASVFLVSCNTHCVQMHRWKTMQVEGQVSACPCDLCCVSADHEHWYVQRYGANIQHGGAGSESFSTPSPPPPFQIGHRCWDLLKFWLEFFFADILYGRC